MIRSHLFLTILTTHHCNGRKHDVLENNFVSLKYFGFWFELEAICRAVHHQRILLQSDLLPREEDQGGPRDGPQPTFPDDVLHVAQLVQLGRAQSGKTVPGREESFIQPQHDTVTLQAGTTGKLIMIIREG